MSSTNTPITLKIHHGDDIRRLHLETLEWKELTQLLSSTYPSPYTLKYRDTDNDLVTMVAQQDLQDAYDMSQGDVIHLYVISNTESASASASASAVSAPASTSAPDLDMKSSDDDLASELSSEEISTLLSECLSDPSIITEIPSFLSTCMDHLSNNMSHSNPLSTAWTHALQQHIIIRDHVILSVLLPRMQQAIIRADSNNMASRIPTHVFPMIKGLLPMLPAFLPTLVPMFTQLMTNPNNPNNPSSTTTTGTQQQAQNNPFATNPLMNLLGPMLSGMQQAQATSPSTTASTSSAPAAPFNPLSLLGPLLAGAAANPAAASSSNTSSQAQANPLLGLLGPLLAANANNNSAANNPLASLMQQFAAQANDHSSTSSTTNNNINNNNNNNNNNNSTADYTEQLALLESMQVGTPEMNLSLLQQCDGSVERVVQLLAME